MLDLRRAIHPTLCGMSLCISAPSALAAIFVANAPSTVIDAVGSTAFNAKLRLSAGNFDQSLATTGGTGAGNVVSANLGTIPIISATSYQFTLQHRVGQGFIFTTIGNQPTPLTSIVAFGSGFSPALPTANATTSVSSAATLSSNTAGGPQIAATALANYNSLRLEVRTSEVAGDPPESITFANLVFNSPTIFLADGSLTTSGTIVPLTPGSASGEIVNGIPTVAATGTLFQRIITDEPLNNHDWSFSGNVQLVRSGTGDGEGLRFVIYGQTVTATLIPEPSSTALGLLTLASLLLRRKR